MATWHEIADLLAQRMENYAFCNSHSERKAVPGICAFCADRAAYRAWQAKAGVTDKPYEGASVSVFDLIRQARGEDGSQ